MRLRQLWRRLHLWSGLVAGIAMVLLGLSGSALVYQDEILDFLYPDIMQVIPGSRPASASVLIAAAAAHSGLPVLYLRYPARPDRPVRAVLAGRNGSSATWLLDPYSAQARGPLPGPFFAFIFDLHSRLMLGNTGKHIVGWLGLTAALLAVSGLVLWYPRRWQWKTAFRIHWKAGTWRLNFDLHKSGGAWVALPLLLLGLSGSAIVFRESLLPAIHVFGGKQPGLAMPISTGATNIDAMIGVAQDLLPGSRLVFVSPPRQAGGDTRIRLRLPGEIHQNGRSYILFDAAGRVTEMQNAPALPVANTVFDQLPYPLHTGFLFGTAGRLVVFLAGLLPALLFGTGLYLWLCRRGVRPR